MSTFFAERSWALLTDFYELTMAYGYWKMQMTHYQSVFHLFFRRLPFHGGYCIFAGLHNVIEYLKNYRFDASDLSYLESLKDYNVCAFFEPTFLDYLATLKFECQLDALPEGTVVFPYEPMLRIQGPINSMSIVRKPTFNTL